MCLIVFGYKTHPDHYLVLAANRDEFYNRPTRNAGFWASDPALLAGKDLKSGGTWMGVHLDGRFAAVTNHRDITSYNPKSKSRGHLVTGYLQSDNSPQIFLKLLRGEFNNYNGFNLLTGTMKQLYWASNRGGNMEEVPVGVHGLSNALLNTPWPKVEKTKSRFTRLTDDGNMDDHHLFELLADTDIYPPEALPDTGLSEEMERAVSAGFIRTRDYGTRSSTLLYIRYDGAARFVERVYNPVSMEISDENSFSFSFNEMPER